VLAHHSFHLLSSYLGPGLQIWLLQRMFGPFLDRSHFLASVFCCRLPGGTRVYQILCLCRAQPATHTSSVQVVVCTQYCISQSGHPLSPHCKCRMANSVMSPTDTEMSFLIFSTSLATVLANKECRLHLFLLKFCERALGSYGSVQGTKSSFSLHFLLLMLWSWEHNVRLTNVSYVFSLPPPWGRRYSSFSILLLGSLWPLTWRGEELDHLPAASQLLPDVWDQLLSGLQVQQLWITQIPHLQNSICRKLPGSGQPGFSTEIELDLKSEVGLITSKHSSVLSHWYQHAC